VHGTAAPYPVAERLSVLPAGDATAARSVGDTFARIGAFAQQLRHEYDWVVLDTAPAAVLPNASLLAAFVDGAVLVVAAGRTEVSLIDRAIASVGRQRIVGVVLNGVGGAGKTASHRSSHHSRR
jgi:Mrp family chromosome partitioning ATPase